MHTAARLFPLALLSLAALAAPLLSVGPANADTERQDDKRAALILDQIPLPPGSKMVHVGNRGRSYVVSISSGEVLAFFRERLPILGWSERSVAPGTGQASGLDGTSDSAVTGGSSGEGTGGPEVSNRGPDAGGLAGGSARNIAAVDRATFSRPDARVKVVARSARNGRAQTGSNIENTIDQSTYRLAVKVR